MDKCEMCKEKTLNGEYSSDGEFICRNCCEFSKDTWDDYGDEINHLVMQMKRYSA